MNEQAVQTVQVVDAELGEMLDISRVAAESYEDIATHVPMMTNDELLETIDYLSTVGQRAFWLRGLCLLELDRRIDELAEQARVDGRAFNAQVEKGKVVRDVAARTGVGERELRRDRQIVEAIAPIVAERSGMTATDVMSVAVMLPEGIGTAVADVIAREKDPDRAFGVAMEFLAEKPTVPLRAFCQALADRKKEEAADEAVPETPAPETPAQPATARAVVTRTEFVSGSISFEAKAKLLKIQEKENLPTVGLALERAIDVAWDLVISKRRSDARNAVK